MKKMNSVLWIYIAIGVMLLCVGALAFQKIFFIEDENKIGRTQEVYYNPYMGFAINADYPEAVQNATLVYVDITWREWEPEEGQYNIEQIWEENNLDRWKAEGKHVVLRFVCDVPDEEEHMDIPDWLYEKTGDGVFYDTDYGKGYSPEYSNSYFIEKHREAILALGEAFEDTGLLAYVELGSLGHWGEWHTNYAQGVNRMPSSQVRQQYVEAYEEAFSYAMLLSRRPFEETANAGCGVYNDMIGSVTDTEEWLSWIEEGGLYEQPIEEETLVSQKNVWEEAPVGGEFTSALSYETMLFKKLDTTISLLKDSHTTFIGPNCPIMEDAENYADGINEVLRTIGYRYGVSKATLSYWRWVEKGSLELVVKNRGVAPIYVPWKMYLYIYEEDRLVERREIPIDLMKLTGESEIEVTMENIPIDENYRYGVGIENPDTELPEVYLDMDSDEVELIYDLEFFK